jgi:hypothetical protein
MTQIGTATVILPPGRDRPWSSSPRCKRAQRRADGRRYLARAAGRESRQREREVDAELARSPQNTSAGLEPYAP